MSKERWAAISSVVSVLSVCLVAATINQENSAENPRLVGLHSVASSQGAHASHRQLAAQAAAGPPAVPAAAKTRTQMKYTIPGFGPRIVGRGYIVTGHDLSSDSGLSFPAAMNKVEALKESCVKACKGNEKCVAYTYHPSKATCFLKSGIDGVGGEDCGTGPDCWFWGEV